MTSPMEQTQLEIINYAIKHFDVVSTGPELLDYSSDILKQILNADDLNIDYEFDVFQAVMRWYEHAKEERQTQLPQLIASIRLVHFAPEYIEKYVKPLFGCEQIANDALKWIEDETTQAKQYESLPSFAKLRNNRKSFLLILNDETKLKYILRSNRTLNKWEKCFEFEFVDDSFGLAYHEGYLFFIGGRSQGVESNNTVKRLDLKTFKWLEMAKMSQSRFHLSVVIIDKKIYALGGHSNGVPLNTAEVYDISTNHWHALPAMSEHRSDAAAIVYEEKIYMFGGLGIDFQPLSSVECYDPFYGIWEERESMYAGGDSLGVTILGDFIYVIGGFNEGEMSSVERFDPDENEWETVARLDVPRCNTCVVTFENQIWALGGHDNDTVEKYDYVNDKWVEEPPLPVNGVHKCVEVPNYLVDKLQTKYFCK